MATRSFESGLCESAPAASRLEPLDNAVAAVPAPASPAPRVDVFWGRVGWAGRNASLLLAALAIIVAVLAWLGPQSAAANRSLLAKVDAEVDKRLAQPSSRLGVHSQMLNELSGSVQGMSRFVRMLAAEKLEESASLSSGEFRGGLLEIGAALQVAKGERIRLGEDLMAAIRNQLLDTDSNAEHFWPATAAFVSLRSPVLPPSLPPCPSRPEEPSGARTGLEVAGEPRSTFSRCVMILDGKTLARVGFTWARVVYRGGPISLGPKVWFTDCEFDIQIPAEPPFAGRDLMRALLAADSVQSIRLN